jgi:phage tail sheath gpL-like
MPLSFRYIPSTLRTPFFFAEVDPTNLNTAQQNYVGLLIGQLLPTGNRVITATTNAAQASGTTLNFSAASIANLNSSGYIFALDRTSPSAIPALTNVTAVNKSTGVVSLSAIATGVGSGDSIQFVDLTPVWITSQANCAAMFGQGSQLARMNAARLQADNFGQWWAQPLPDDLQSIKATGSIILTGSPTSSGSLSFYISGIAVPVAVAAAATASTMATAVAAAINAAVGPLNGILPVSAVASTNTVNLTALNGGAAGNDIDIRINYYGPANNEAVPPGMAVQISPMAGGATNPTSWLTGLLAMIPQSQPFAAIANPYSDTTSLNAIQLWMGDISGQWAWSTMNYGCVFAAMNGSAGTLQTAGSARNDQHMTIMGVNASPSDPPLWAATIAGAAMAAQRAQPGASLNSIQLPGLLPPSPINLFPLPVQNTFLWSGISTFSVVGGNVSVQKLITTYQFNSFGDPDNSFLEVETMYRIAYAIQQMKIQTQSQYAGYLLADDGTRFAPGINVATPSLIAAFIVSIYQQLIYQGICQDLAQFQAALLVERNQQNPGRVDILWPGILINDLDIVALLAQPIQPTYQ